MNDERHYCQISVKGLALAGAILLGSYLFLLAFLAGWGRRFMWVSPELVEIISAVYPGYVVGLSGAVIGRDRERFPIWRSKQPFQVG